MLVGQELRRGDPIRSDEQRRAESMHGRRWHERASKAEDPDRAKGSITITDIHTSHRSDIIGMRKRSSEASHAR